MPTRAGNTGSSTSPRPSDGAEIGVAGPARKAPVISTPTRPQWIDVPGGWFWMGGGPRDNENPRHRVWVDPFRLARTQVRRADYQRFLDVTGNPAPPFWDEPRFSDPQMPAVGPSWEDADAFCRWAGRL